MSPKKATFPPAWKLQGNAAFTQDFLMQKIILGHCTARRHTDASQHFAAHHNAPADNRCAGASGCSLLVHRPSASSAVRAGVRASSPAPYAIANRHPRVISPSAAKGDGHSGALPSVSSVALHSHERVLALDRRHPPRPRAPSRTGVHTSQVTAGEGRRAFWSPAVCVIRSPALARAGARARPSASSVAPCAIANRCQLGDRPGLSHKCGPVRCRHLLAISMATKADFLR
ncbi:hypothetical protein C8Q80DRAFT_1124074 [Daedaleopsis nitida]|nr:hypothetical protein C8Q80DRAFT_1124074 [Daedaleopsis nitida]